MIFILVTSTLAHMHMTTPAAQFPPEFVSNANAPSSLCSLIPYYPGSNDILIPGFNNDLKAKGFGSLREYADACARTAQGKICGNSLPDAVVPIPSDGTAVIEIGADHIGPSEIWVDDVLVMYNPGIVRGSVQKTPPTTRVDYSQVCPSGSCRVRFVMAALHNYPAEIFDNCVTIGAPGSNASKATVQNSVPVSSTDDSYAPSSPEVNQSQHRSATVSGSKPDETTGGSEWSCSESSLGLVRTVGADQYKFECAAGTKCSTVDVPYAMCVHI